MKVALAVSEYHRRGGFPRHGAQLATSLMLLGHETTVLTQRAETDQRDSGIDFRFYSTPLSGLVHMAVEPVVLTRQFKRIDREFDVLVSVGIPCLAPVILVGPGTHRGFVVATQSMLPRSSPRRWLEPFRPFHRVVLGWERAMLRGNHPLLVIVPTERFAREYSEFYGFPPGRVAIHSHSYEPAEFTFDVELRRKTRSELGIDDDTRLFLQVGGRFRQKGVDVLLRALEALPREMKWHAVLGGQGSEQRATKEAAARLVQEGRVSLLGRVEEVRSLYCAADLLVFPSRYDPWGLVVTEAISCGLPVVCSPEMGAASAVRAGVNGMVMEDAEDFLRLRDLIVEMSSKQFDRSAVASSIHWMAPENLAPELQLLLDRVAEERRQLRTSRD